MSYFIMLVDNEVPMYTYYTLQDAEKQMMKVMNSEFGVEKLSVSAFINASGKAIKISLESPKESHPGITFS